MTELEKMQAGELFNVYDPEVYEICLQAKRRLEKLNAASICDPDSYRQALHELLPGAHETAMVIPPFFCDYGLPVRLGEGVYINARCTMLDGGGITIGAHTKVGPDCKFYTPQHPIDYEERRKPIERNLAISVGEDCWLGGNVTVCPGVKIGDRCIIAAGSVVVRDIPDDSLAAGNPAVVKRKLR